MQYPRTKKPRKISDAVFRGKSSAYSFQVYPLASEILDTPGVFILSRRRTDKFGHGHQSAVCIGEANSIAAELKKHKRAKCVKNNEPNVVCILTEESPATRTSVLKDLTDARKFGCIRNVYDSTIKPKSYEPIKLSGRRRSVAPAPVPDVKVETVAGKPGRKPAVRSAAAKAVSKPDRKARKTDPRTAKAAPVRSVARTVAKPQRKPNKPLAVAPAKAGSSKTAAGTSKRKQVIAVKRPAARSAAAEPVKTTRVAAVPAAAKRSNAKRVAAAKPAPLAGRATKSVAAKSRAAQPKAAKQPVAVKSKIASKRVKAATAKKTGTAKSRQPAKPAASARGTKPAAARSRVQGGVDSNRRQHRLPKPEKPVNKRTKSRADGKPRSRQKTAA
jgi:histone H1/5